MKGVYGRNVEDDCGKGHGHNANDDSEPLTGKCAKTSLPGKKAPAAEMAKGSETLYDQVPEPLRD